MELAVGNDGLRLLLDDMSIEYEYAGTDDTTEDIKKTLNSNDVANAIRQGNLDYNEAYDYHADINELSEDEMDDIISYAGEHNIEIIPMINTPGHMNTMISAMEILGIEYPGLNGSATSLDASNVEARAFTIALLDKYMTYFSGKGCRLFNIACDEYGDWTGFQTLIDQGKYDIFAEYVNELAHLTRTHDMQPVAFNDGFYYNGVSPETVDFDKGILIAYWSNGWGGYYLSSARALEEKGFYILNTNSSWYYVLGNYSGFNYNSAQNGMKTKTYRDVPGYNDMSADSVAGCMFAVWCDEPKYEYDDTEKERVFDLIHLMSERHPGIFHPKADLKDATITLNKEIFDYTGSEIKPSVNVLIGNKVLSEGTDYRLSYEDNIEIGFGKISIRAVEGNEQYTGQNEKGFVIRREEAQRRA